MKRTAFFGGLLALMLCVGAIVTATPTHAAAVARESSSVCTNSLAAETSRAALVVTFGDGHSETFCIEFSGDTITGLEQLQRSGLPLVTNGSGGLGSAVCSIGGEGSNDPTACFASCTGGTCQYWAFYRYQNGAWKFSQIGASQTTVHDGDIFGWSWGPGGNGGAPDAPGEICPVPTSTPLASATPAPLPPTATPEPVEPPPDTETSPIPVPTAESDPATVKPSGALPPGEPSPPQSALPASGEPPAPTPTPESAVEGAALSPATATNTASATPAARSTASASRTAKSGAVVIDDQQGAQNQTRSESQSAAEGGSKLSLIAFAIVAVALMGIGGGVFYWRRRAL